MKRVGVEPPIVRMTTADALALVDFDQYLYADVETYNDSKHYARKGVGVDDAGFYGKVRLVQLMQAHWDSVVIIDMKLAGNSIEELVELVHRAYVVGQTFCYDMATIQEHNGDKYRKWDVHRYDDTWIMAKELLPMLNGHVAFGSRYSLDLLFEWALGTCPYTAQGIDKKYMQKLPWDGILLPMQMVYAAIDVWWLPELHAELLKLQTQLAQGNAHVWDAYHTRVYIAKLSMDAGLKMQSTGFVCDSDELAGYIETQGKEASMQWTLLKEHGFPEDVSLGSHKKVAEFLGSTSSDKYQLAFLRYRDGDDRAKMIQDTRAAEYRCNMAKKWAELTLDNGKITGKYQPTTMTGRFRSAQENMQNAPRDTKGLIRPVREGGMVIAFDFAQIELRTMCAIAGEPRMYQVFKEGGDIHKATMEMCGITDRTVAKRINFGLQYGAGAASFQKQLVVDGVYLEEDVCRELIRVFKGTYEYLGRYQQENAHRIKHQESRHSMMGQPFYSCRYTQMQNLANQASGTSETLKMAFNGYYEWDIVDSPIIELATSIHDMVAFYYYGDPEHLDMYAYLIGLLAQRGWFQALSIGYNIGTAMYDDIPMPISVGYGESVGQAMAMADDDNKAIKVEGSAYYNQQEECEQWLAQVRIAHDTLKKEVV